MPADSAAIGESYHNRYIYPGARTQVQIWKYGNTGRV